ncbi:efflux RND transporter periplasmic adaptor subunit [Microbacterium kribbense]|uniref:Efflux RND transporter periplasmic adaptor subunit n=1 Tax=Microbacterium kribbense TaxID=433645 RepID=A0ABP7G893_9MICO
MSAPTFLSRVPRWTLVTVATAVAAAVVLSIWTFGFLLPGQSTSAATIYRTATASLQTLQKTVAGTGTVAPTVQDSVSFAVAGTVTDVAVKTGATVKKGQTLAKVDTLQLNAALLQAKATLAQAQATLSSAESANGGTAADVARVSAASAAVDVAAAAVTDAQTAMSDATLTAPAAGLITAVTIATGDKISGTSAAGSGSANASTGAGTGSGGGAASANGSAAASSSTHSADFTLVSTDSWTLSVSVGETDITNVAVGDQVDLTDTDGTAYFGTVSQVGDLPSTTSGAAAYPVTIAVTGTGKGLFDGVSLTAAIVYQRRTDVLAVPSAAVTTTGSTSTVQVVGSDGTHTTVTVKVGETAGGYTEITSGIKEGTTVVVASFTPRTSTHTGQTGTPDRGFGGFSGGGGFRGGTGAGGTGTGGTGGFTNGGSYTGGQRGTQGGN